MAATLLISLNDIKEYRAMADLASDRVNQSILEAQENDLRPVLNNALYLDFIKNFSQQKYQDLLFGKEWTYLGQVQQFNGVRPALVYFSLARLVISNQLNITSFGIVQKTNQSSTPVDASSIKMLVTELRSIAARYLDDLILFLINNPTTYPLYNTLPSSSQGNRTGFKIFRA